MAVIVIDPEFDDFYRTLLSILAERKVEMSAYATGLLALSVEGWFRDYPMKRFDPSVTITSCVWLRVIISAISVCG